MSKLILLLTIFPFLLTAQSKKRVPKKPLLIQSITSDTVEGKYRKVLFSYDQRNRVIGITYTIGNFSDESIQEKQTFEYQDTATLPFVRKDLVYIHNKKNNQWTLRSYWENYYLIENGHRIGDSVLVVFNEKNEQKWDWRKEKFDIRIGKFIQTNKKVYHENDFTPPYSAPNVYREQLNLEDQLNINYEAKEHRYGNRGRDGAYYTFSTYDSKINPLNQLNIAPLLSNEKITFHTNEEGTDIMSFYFVNQNNVLNYIITFDEQSSDRNTTVRLKYTYNQYKLPVYIKVQINNGTEVNKRFTLKYL